jgi:hypothetical protein
LNILNKAGRIAFGVHEMHLNFGARERLSSAPFAILRYDPTDEWDLRREVKLLATRLEAVGNEVHEIRISDLLWQAINETEGLDEVVGLERIAHFIIPLPLPFDQICSLPRCSHLVWLKHLSHRLGRQVRLPSCPKVNIFCKKIRHSNTTRLTPCAALANFNTATTLGE